jgi:septal ring factor EnvC (AmiA/AmiB activator)
MTAALEAAQGGRDKFAAWWKDKSNGGQTTKDQREVLKHSLAEFQATATAADEKRKADAAAEAEAKADTPAATEGGPTFGDDTRGGTA